MQAFTQDTAAPPATTNSVVLKGALGVAIAAAALLLSWRPASADEKWSAAAPMPIGRGGGAAVQANRNTAYIVDGFASFLGDSNLNLKMRVQQGVVQYSFVTPAPTARAEVAATRRGNRIYVAGGRSRGGTIPPYNIKILDNFEVYNISQDAWQALQPMPTKRAGLGLATRGSRIYAIGGRTGGQGILKTGTVLNTLEIYNVNTGQWSAGNPMPTARSDFAVAVKGSKIYVIGGWDGSDPEGGDLATVEVLNTSNGQWSSATSMPTARTALAAAVKGDLIYALGGHTGLVAPTNELSTAEAFDAPGDDWESIDPMNQVRAQAGAVRLGSSIYAVGGRFYPAVSGSAGVGTGVEVFEDD